MTEPKVGEHRPGGRSARTRADVLAATIEVLGESDYEALRIEDVAARAGVNKTTIYRRWPTRAELVADAVRERSAEAVPQPDTGALGSDLRALARSVAANIGSPEGGRLTTTLVAAALTSDEVAVGTTTFWSDRLRLAAAIVERAVDRGELAAGADADLVIETLIGPLYVRRLLTGEPLSRRFADRVAELVTAGARAAFPPPG